MKIGENKYLDSIAEDVWKKLSPTSTTRVTTKLLKRILLNYGDSTFYNGKMCVLSKRSLGAGVYEIGLKVKEME